ncbi:MAG: DNA primase [Omnitrophica WOR_2 bacterium RIFCSPHIGHO2_02_FULL_48_11]|nr:MAG: DNA primase [Omnitrophica WOR_2 bacterium RIFCSPHIGHO2_02_FULL_48_11]
MGMIPQDIIREVLERADIVSTVSAYISLKRAGRNYKALCPFHTEKTPSFVVNPDKQIFHCFGCGEGGNAITFVMKQEHLDFPDAIRRMAERASIVIPERETGDPKIRDLKQALGHVNELAAQFFHQYLMTSRDEATKQARDYLKKRAVSLEIVEKFRLGFAPDQWDGLLDFLRKKDISPSLMEKAGLIIAREKQDGHYDRFRNRIMFPIFDIKGQCIAFGARAMKKDDAAKYINSPETEIYVKGQHLYGLHMAKPAVSQEDRVIVVEGYMDFIMPYQAGVLSIAASLGTALTVEQIRLIRRYTKNIVMLYDTDKAGEAATLRSLDMLIEEGMNVQVATLTEGDDPDSFVCKFGGAALLEQVQKAQNLFDYKLTLLKQQFDSRSVEGRARICAEMLPTINKFENAIVKSEYMKQLAQTLSISQEALIAEMQKLVAHSRGEAREPAPQRGLLKEQPRKVEQNILKLMLEDENFVSLTKEEIPLSDFRDASIRTIISEIYKLFEDGKEINPLNLMNCFDDQHVRSIIAGLTVHEEVGVVDKNKVYRDCVDRMIQDRRKSQRQELLIKIRSAEVTGNHAVLEQLKEQYNQLVKNKG